MFLQLLNECLRAALVEVQRRVRGATLEDEDEVRPAEARTGPTETFQVADVKVDVVLVVGGRGRHTRLHRHGL